jgi:hypothetical protein
MSIAEVSAATRPANPTRYPINLRITIPFFPRSIFITIIVGQEKRGRDRLAEERARHPVNTWGNVITVTMTLGVVSIAALFAALIAASI